MRATTALLLKELLSKLHPPAPTTSQESQRLVRLLETSFRRRLDDLHPSPRLSLENHLQQNQGPIVHPRATDSHLGSVLHHPLLTAGLSKSVDHKGQRATERFEEAVRNSNVTPRLIHQSCIQYLDTIGRSQNTSDGTLGSKLAAWLSSVSTTKRWEVLTDIRLVPVMILVMYTDQMEAEVWDWLSTVYERDCGDLDVQSLPTRDLLDVEDLFVSTMTRMSIRLGEMEDAVQQFVKASEYRVASGRASVQFDMKQSKLEYAPLLRSWKRISAAVLVQRHKHGISASTFNDLIDVSIPSTVHPVISKGFMMLYHPEKPASELLYQELSSENIAQPWASWPRMRSAFVLAILDAAELSLSHHQPLQTRFFLDRAQALWPTMFKTNKSLQPAERLEHAWEEAAAMNHIPDFALT